LWTRQGGGDAGVGGYAPLLRATPAVRLLRTARLASDSWHTVFALLVGMVLSGAAVTATLWFTRPDES